MLTVSVNMAVRSGPWGGGNRFLSQLLRNLGSVSFTNKLDSSVDVILCIDCRDSENVCYTVVEAIRFGDQFNIPVVVRVNECFERNRIFYGTVCAALAVRAADKSVFVSSWLQRRWYYQGVTNKVVIRNGVNFDSTHLLRPKIPGNKAFIKLVTHHWGAHENKGWDVYRAIESRLQRWPNIQFSFIGNAPKTLENCHNRFEVLPPVNQSDVVTVLAGYDIYLTASRFEPGPNHILEAIEAGLPIIYRLDSTLDEYLREVEGCFAFSCVDELPDLINYITDSDYCDFRESCIPRHELLFDSTKWYDTLKEVTPGDTRCSVLKSLSKNLISFVYLSRNIYKRIIAVYLRSASIVGLSKK